MVHLLAPFKIGSNASPQVIGGVTNVNVSPEVAEEVRHNGGAVDPAMVFGGDGEPKVNASTLCVMAALGQMTELYLGVSSSALAEFYVQAATAQGTRASGSSHKKYVVNKGLMVPQTLSVDQNGDATLELATYCVDDGTNAPIVETSSVALPASSLSEVFTLGPVQISAAWLEGIKGWSLDFGAQVKSEHYDGKVFPQVCYVEKFQPRVTVRGINTTVLNTYGIAGSALNTTAKLWLRKRKPNYQVYADTDSQHACLTLYGRIAPSGPSGGDGTLENSFVLSVVKSGANALVAQSTLQQIALG